MAINFPDSPSNGQTHTVGSKTFVYNSVSTSWSPQSSSGGSSDTPAIIDSSGTPVLASGITDAEVKTLLNISAGVAVSQYANQSGFPTSGNSVGDFAFAQDSKSLYHWDGTEWDRAAGALPASLSAVTPTAYNGESGQEFTISGANFAAGDVIDFVTTQNTVHRASATNVDNSGQIRATTPQAFTVANSPLTIRHQSASGDQVSLANSVTTGASPVWTTAAGSLGTFKKDATVNVTVAATDADGQTVTITKDSGDLPPGTSFSNGTISGAITTASISSDTTYSHTASASDGVNSISRTFDITILNQVTTKGYFYFDPGAYDITLPAGDYLFVLIGGGGSGSSGGNGGAGGVMPFKVNVPSQATFELGIGAGGGINAYGNHADYIMRGGAGGSSVGGAGGGGTYVADTDDVLSKSITVGSKKLAMIAGGGGGGAVHNYNYNEGGPGIGVGGPAYSTSGPNSTYGGNHGFPMPHPGYNRGDGGSAQSNGRNGGSATIDGQMYGGAGGSGSNSGGGGGGGAGGGGGGAQASSNGGAGGYLNFGNAGFTEADMGFRPGGGGGGGSHGNSCGGNGGGGGSLYFNDYGITTVTYPSVGPFDKLTPSNIWTSPTPGSTWRLPSTAFSGANSGYNVAAGYLDNLSLNIWSSSSWITGSNVANNTPNAKGQGGTGAGTYASHGMIAILQWGIDISAANTLEQFHTKTRDY